MRVAAITAIVIVGVMDLLFFMGISKLEHEAEEQEWRELTEKRERDDT